ncbi:MAG: helix-turn-helix domain-containing protein [Gordonia sp. (in: high G+C Gram-positive bacteria)]
MPVRTPRAALSPTETVWHCFSTSRLPRGYEQQWRVRGPTEPRQFNLSALFGPPRSVDPRVKLDHPARGPLRIPRRTLEFAVSQTPSPLVSAPQLAEHLGVAPVTVLRLVQREGLPAHRVGTGTARRTYRFDITEVDAWLRARDSDAQPAREPDEFVAATLAKFTSDDLRRAAEVLRALADAR